MSRRTLLLGVVLAALPLGRSWSHEVRPGYLEIRETAPETYRVLWKVPARGEYERLGLDLRFDDEVEVLGEPVGAFISGAHLQRMVIRRPGGLAGSTIRIDGLSGTYTDVLLRIEFLDGTELARRLTPDRPAYEVEDAPGPGQVAGAYFLLGVEHILLGIDHLLFVLALLFVVADRRSLLITITAFTAAHSITLAMATLGYVAVPVPPVEAVIALSIVFVATEMVRGLRGEPGLTSRRPWIVSFSFGLLHGFGFAGALSEVGLPGSAIPLALLTFNLGVEAGQLLFVAAVFTLAGLARLVPISPPRWVCELPAYVIGGVAAYWMIERTAGFLN